jgi:hypothetical protein
MRPLSLLADEAVAEGEFADEPDEPLEIESMMEEQAMGTIEEPENDPFAGDDEMDDAMAWLEQLAAEQGAPLDELPSLSNDLDLPTADAEPAADSTGLPDWLQMELDDPAQAGLTADEPTLPDWLQVDSPSDPLDAESDFDEALTDWADDLGANFAELEDPPLAQAELPDWLRPPAEIDAPAPQPAAEMDDLSWLDQIAAGQMEPVGEEPTWEWEDSDALLDAVSSSAEEPTDTFDAEETLIAAPTAVESDLIADLLADDADDDDALGWLQEMADQDQEDSLAEMALLDDDALPEAAAASFEAADSFETADSFDSFDDLDAPFAFAADDMMTSEALVADDDWPDSLTMAAGETDLDDLWPSDTEEEAAPAADFGLDMPEDSDDALAWLDDLAAQQDDSLDDLPPLFDDSDDMADEAFDLADIDDLFGEPEAAVEPYPAESDAAESAAVEADLEFDPQMEFDRQMEFGLEDEGDAGLAWLGDIEAEIQAEIEAEKQAEKQAAFAAAAEIETADASDALADDLSDADITEDPDDAMAWLEQLAAQQGAPLDELPSVTQAIVSEPDAGEPDAAVTDTFLDELAETDEDDLFDFEFTPIEYFPDFPDDRTGGR